MQEPLQTRALGAANLWQTQPAGHVLHPLLVNDALKPQKFSSGGVCTLRWSNSWLELGYLKFQLFLHLHRENKLEWSDVYQDQPALPKLFVAPNTGEGLAEVCGTVQLIVTPTETNQNPAHLYKGPHPGLSLLLQPQSFAWTWQVPYNCKVKLRTEINSKALTSLSRTRISHYDFLLYGKKKNQGGWSSTSHRPNIWDQ